jgi:hypothetical protein
MITLIPTFLVPDITIKGHGIEFIGTVEVFHTHNSYIIVRSFVGDMTKTISAHPTPVQGRWEKGPVFNKLKRLSFSHKEFLEKAKSMIRWGEDPLQGEDDAPLNR